MPHSLTRVAGLSPGSSTSDSASYKYASWKSIDDDSIESLYPWGRTTGTPDFWLWLFWTSNEPADGRPLFQIEWKWSFKMFNNILVTIYHSSHINFSSRPAINHRYPKIKFKD